MLMILIFSIIVFFIILIYHIATQNLNYFEWLECAGWSLICGCLLWVGISCLGGAIAGAIIAPEHHREVYVSTIIDEIYYNIVPLHEYDASYPEGLYLESFRENDTSKYRFVYEQDGAIYSKTINQNHCILGYCTSDTPASAIFYDRDLPNEFMRFIFIDSICDIYNIKIPHGTIYVRPTN